MSQKEHIEGEKMKKNETAGSTDYMLMKRMMFSLFCNSLEVQQESK